MPNTNIYRARRLPRLCLIMFSWSGFTAYASDWPRFLGPSGDGRSTETGLLRQWPKDGPTKLWERKIGAGYAGPAVSGGKRGLFHRTGDDEGGESLDAKSVAAQWKYSTPTGYVDDFNFDDGPRGVPAISGGQVFTLGAEGRLTCLELASGRKLWDRDLANDYPFKKGFFGVGTS